jgi:hypothetical protein
MKFFLRTRSIRIVAALAVASGTAGLASLTALSGPSAQADPVSTNAEVGVGADVLQDVFEGLSGAAAPNTTSTQFFLPIHSGGGSDNTTIESFDAFPSGGSTLTPGCITTKTGGPAFDRPNSTTNGITALSDEVNGVGWEDTSNTSCTNALVSLTGQIDFARAARGPKSGGTTLTFAPFARDAVAYLYFDHGDGALNSLTTAQLKSLYSGGITTISGDTVKPCLTITGSAPRSNLETAIGDSDSVAQPIAHAAGCDQIQQNSGNAFYSFASTLPSGTDAILPISAGDWIGQANGVAVDESATARANGITVGAVTDGATNLGLPTTGTAPNLAANTTYYQDTSYGYNVYTVLPTDVLSGFGEDAALVSLFTNTSTLPANSAAICQTTEQGIIHQFGFDSLTSAEGSCGSTTTKGDT